ncbi:MAG: alpha/beta fold hydrolase [Bacillota bacterium]|nr:alpha/beta fold hydrolase [Bacillota bacterium]
MALEALIRDVRLVYERSGETGVPFLTLHGGPGLSGRQGDVATFARYAEEGFQVVSYDQRGSGESEGRPPYSHEAWVEDAEALRQHLGWGPMVLAGGSYGGHIALEYALRYPQNLLALILRDTAASNAYHAKAMETALNSPYPIDKERLERLFAGRVHDDEDFKQCYREILPLYRAEPPSEEEMDRQLAGIIFRHETHNWAFSQNMASFDLTPRLGEIEVPTLILCGRHDWITPVEASEELASLMPRARLVIFEQSGHSPQFEEEDKFHREVRRFLQEVLPGESRKGLSR